MPVILLILSKHVNALLKAKKMKLNMHNITVMASCCLPPKTCISATLAKMHFVDYFSDRYLCDSALHSRETKFRQVLPKPNQGYILPI